MCRLTDNFLRFWFRYVPPNRSTLEQGRTAPVPRSVAETLATRASWTFEDVCRQAVRTEAFPITSSRVGRWWDDGQEVDIVCLDESTDTLVLGECKWADDLLGSGLLDDLEALEPDVR